VKACSSRYSFLSDRPPSRVLDYNMIRGKIIPLSVVYLINMNINHTSTHTCAVQSKAELSKRQVKIRDLVGMCILKRLQVCQVDSLIELANDTCIQTSDRQIYKLGLDVDASTI